MLQAWRRWQIPCQNLWLKGDCAKSATVGSTVAACASAWIWKNRSGAGFSISIPSTRSSTADMLPATCRLICAQPCYVSRPSGCQYFCGHEVKKRHITLSRVPGDDLPCADAQGGHQCWSDISFALELSIGFVRRGSVPSLSNI